MERSVDGVNSECSIIPEKFMWPLCKGSLLYRAKDDPAMKAGFQNSFAVLFLLSNLSQGCLLAMEPNWVSYCVPSHINVSSSVRSCQFSSPSNKFT